MGAADARMPARRPVSRAPGKLIPGPSHSVLELVGGSTQAAAICAASVLSTVIA